MHAMDILLAAFISLSQRATSDLTLTWIGEQSSQVNYLIFNDEPLEETAWCSIPFTEDNIGSVYLMLSYTLIYFIIPMITVTILYIRSTEERLNREGSSESTFSRIGLSLHRRETLGEETVAATGPDNHQIDQAR